MKSSNPIRLSLMMFLQYAVWGFWLPILGRYLQAPVTDGGLGFTPGQVGWIIGLAGSIGAVLAPFIGQLADRYFSSERCLGVLLFAGGIVKWITAYQTGFLPWVLLSIVYSILYMPTLALTNSVAFANLDDPKVKFPYIRVWGTIGWIVASWVFPMFWLQHSLEFQKMPPFLSGPEMADSTHRLVDALKISGGLSMVYAIYCLFFLPHTPPKQDAVQSLALTRALGLFRKPSFTVLVAASLPVSIIHQIYFMQTAPFFKALGLENSQIGPAMSIGQFAEIGALALLGFMLTRVGYRWVIFIGIMAYFLRYAIFGSVDLPVSLIVASQALHGLCYACFFATGFIYVDRIAPDDIRHSAQTVFGIIILGIGPVISAALLQLLANLYTVNDQLNYSKLWYTLSAIGLITAIAFALLFKDESGPGEVSITAGEAPLTEGLD